MTYTYSVAITLTATVEVTAESSAVAGELAEQFLNLETDDDRVGFPQTDGIVVESIESDEDPEMEDANG